MRTVSLDWTPKGWTAQPNVGLAADLVLYFGTRPTLEDQNPFHRLRDLFPDAHLLGCSTGGQFRTDQIIDEGACAIALKFDSTRLRSCAEAVRGEGDSRACGERIGKQLAGDGLSGVFVLSDGLNVNGSQLVSGLCSQLGAVPIAGGMAAEIGQFAKTLVGLNRAPESHIVAAVGFYGSKVRIGYGSAAGWDVFGPTRRITRANGNTLLALDGRPALELYERYLEDGEFRELPRSAVRFPLKIHDPAHPEHEIIRAVLAVDKEQRTVTFRGDMPEGWNAQLMRGTCTRLVAGAAQAASQARLGLAEGDAGEAVGILVSCVGRRRMMGQRTEEEVEAAASILGPRYHRLGFYSFGEISPHAASGISDLHNQTMTVTTIAEAAAA